MEEADLLGDRVAVLASGKLRCVGNALALKRRYGQGYRLHLVASDAALDRAIYEARRLMGAEVSLALRDGESAVLATTGKTDGAVLARFLEYLEADAEAGAVADAGEENVVSGERGVREWGVSLPTLEEVFIKVTNDGDTAGTGQEDSEKEEETEEETVADHSIAMKAESDETMSFAVGPSRALHAMLRKWKG